MKKAYNEGQVSLKMTHKKQFYECQEIWRKRITEEHLLWKD